MALNWAMLDDKRNLVPLLNERTILTVDKGVELTLIIPDEPPQGASSGGGSGGTKKLQDIGKLWLTEQRLVFVAASPPGAPLESLSVQLLSILATNFQQPYLGANYLAFDVRPSPDGGLTRGTKAELRFKDRGIFEFVSTLEKARERAVYMKREEEAEIDSLPTYASAAVTPAPTPAPSSEPLSAGPVPAEAPPGYDASI